MPLQKIPVSPEELEFYAEEEPITIVPNFSVPTHSDSLIDGITQSYGPFQPNIPTEVPIWMAIQLYKFNKARIIRPPWLEVEELRRVVSEEQRDPSAFQPMPFYYMEISCLLFESCKACFGDNYNEVREVLQRLINIRRTKIEEGLKQVVSAATVRINHLSAYESNLIRMTFQSTLNMFMTLDAAADVDDTQPDPYSATMSGLG